VAALSADLLSATVPNPPGLSGFLDSCFSNSTKLAEQTEDVGAIFDQTEAVGDDVNQVDAYLSFPFDAGTRNSWL
jgi:hypothetical protein